MRNQFPAFSAMIVGKCGRLHAVGIGKVGAAVVVHDVIFDNCPTAVPPRYRHITSAPVIVVHRVVVDF